MVAHSSGVMGFPLRLLAREVYDRVVRLKGERSVALVTGEERMVPADARYFLCTAESMPTDKDVAFVGLDEAQLGRDGERGHVFTDRMLNRRGREETLVLGAQTVRPMVERLLPGAHVLTRPRLSQLSFAGEKKITRLPRRSAIVAFSVEEVYAIAELIRRQRGGVRFGSAWRRCGCSRPAFCNWADCSRSPRPRRSAGRPQPVRSRSRRRRRTVPSSTG